SSTVWVSGGGDGTVTGTAISGSSGWGPGACGNTSVMTSPGSAATTVRRYTNVSSCVVVRSTFVRTPVTVAPGGIVTVPSPSDLWVMKSATGLPSQSTIMIRASTGAPCTSIVRTVSVPAGPVGRGGRAITAASGLASVVPIAASMLASTPSPASTPAAPPPLP